MKCTVSHKLQIILLLLTSVSSSISVAQDTIRFISRNNQAQFDTIEVIYEELVGHNRTESYQGDLFGRFDLPLIPPNSQLYEGSNYRSYVRAADWFNVHHYPARATVKLGLCRTEEEDRSTNKCTGTLIGERFVLTSAHCIAAQRPEFSDILGSVPISVAPLNGECNDEIKTTITNIIYVPEAYLDRKYYNGGDYPSSLTFSDMALLELSEPIGRKAGWLGIGYSNDAEFYLDKVLHKFAIPGTYNDGRSIQSFADTSLYYNGDTLYYNYGTIDGAEDDLLYINGKVSDGALGQSGSSLFASDNIDYTIYGTQTFSSFGHVKMHKGLFNGFKHIMESRMEIIAGLESSVKLATVYPNPVQSILFIDLNSVLDEQSTMSVISLDGKIRRSKLLRQQKNTFDFTGLPNGIYLLKINCNQEISNFKIIKH